MTNHLVSVRKSAPKLILLILLLLIVGFVFGAISAPNLDGLLRRNLAAVATLKGLRGEATELKSAQATLAQLNQSDCRAAWLQGLASKAVDPASQPLTAWQAAIRCSPEYIGLVRILAPERLDLAELAVQTYPESAEAWFWIASLHAESDPQRAVQEYWQGLQRKPDDMKAWQLLGQSLAALDTGLAMQIFADLGLNDLANSGQTWRVEARFIFAQVLSQEQPEIAIQLYRQALQFKPHDGLRWRELGDLLVKDDPQGAIPAYLQSCYNGDPGWHGCYNAGLTAEHLGDLQAAIRYYRLSKWSGALERAAALENQLNSLQP